MITATIALLVDGLANHSITTEFTALCRVILYTQYTGLSHGRFSPTLDLVAVPGEKDQSSPSHLTCAL
jgi:hypothetical protein